jgi:hypothetical protein
MGHLSVAKALNDETVSPGKARKIIKRISDKHDPKEMRIQAKIIDETDAVTKKIHSAIEYAKTSESLANKTEYRESDRADWLLLSQIAHQTYSAVIKKIEEK